MKNRQVRGKAGWGSRKKIFPYKEEGRHIRCSFDRKSKKNTARKLQKNVDFNIDDLLHQSFQQIEALVHQRRNPVISYSTVGTSSTFLYIYFISSVIANLHCLMQMCSFSPLLLIMILIQGSSCTQCVCTVRVLRGLQKPLFKGELWQTSPQWVRRHCKGILKTR